MPAYVGVPGGTTHVQQGARALSRNEAAVARKPAPAEDYHAFASVTGGICDDACVQRQAPMLAYTQALHPFSSIHKVWALTQLQRTYGNAFVGRVIQAMRTPQPGLESTARRVKPPVIHRAPVGASKIDELRSLLEADQEKGAIALMRRLSPDEVKTVLESRELKERAMDAFNNEEMYQAIQAMGGDLYQSLQWMFDEGTDWDKVREIVGRAASGKDRVRSDDWMKEQFVSICNDKEMIEVVELLGSTPRQKVNWLVAEGVNAKPLYEAVVVPLSMPGEANVVFDVLRTLPRGYRDDVAYHFVSNLSDDTIKALAKDGMGRRLLVLILAEIADGWITGGERKQRDRIMGLVEPDGPDLERAKEEAKAKAEAKKARAAEATELIKAHTHGLNLREEALGADLLSRLPDDSILVEQVLDTLGSTDRDDVSLALFEAATAKQIRTIASDPGGRAVLLRMVQELFKGNIGADEQAQMQWIMKLISEVDHDKGASVEIEVITFLYGGSLDIIGVVAAGGARGHTAIAVGDRVYSFELGWSCGRTKQEYLATNRQERDAVGQVLELIEDDARKVQAKLDASCGKGVYAISGDICTDATARALEGALTNLKGGWNPGRFVGDLEDTGKVKSHRFYPKVR